MTETIATTTLNPNEIQPWHDAHDDSKLASLVNDMTASGWAGAPIVVITSADRDPIAITGSHRIAAAREAGIDVPTIDLDDLLHAHGTSLAAIDDEVGSDPDDEQHYEAVVRLDYYLPAPVIECYGLDAH